MYVKVLETSQSWTCPKTGTYLVTCVAGGQAVSVIDHTGETPTAPDDYYSVTTSGAVGGTTSFGSLLSASCKKFEDLYLEGGKIGTNAHDFDYPRGGFGGYTLDGVYGGVSGCSGNNGSSSPSKNGGFSTNAGLGYGAGGGRSSLNHTNSGNIKHIQFPGVAGDMMVGTFDIDAGTVITCTVGIGGGQTAGQGVTSSTQGRSGVIVIKGV